MTEGEIRKRNVMSQRTSTLCWNCKNTNGTVCPWFEDFTPVKGWTAKPTLLNCPNNSNDDRVVRSFKVIACPLFEPESERSAAAYAEDMSDEEENEEREIKE